MEKDPKARAQEPEKVKADANPARAAKDPAQIPARWQEVARVEAEAKVPDKTEIEVVLKKNNISNIHDKKIIF